MKTYLIFSFTCCALILAGCATLKRIHFPKSDEVFITSGDGDITKPYEPIGHLFYTKKGFRIGLPLIGLIPMADAVPENATIEIIAEKARAMGGNAVINLDLRWDPPKGGILGYRAYGGTLVINGTVIKQTFEPRTSAPTAATGSVATTPTTGTTRPQPSSQLPTSRVDQSPDLMKLFLQGDPGHSPSLAYANLSGDGGGGIRLGYVLRRRGTKLAFTPAISYGVSTTEETFSYTDYDYFTRRYVTRQVETKNHLRLIPVDLNVTANFASFPQFQADLPEGLNPYAEAGLTYLVWSAKAEINSPFDSYETDEDWDFFEIGLNLGLGAEYFVRSNLSLWGGLKRYIIIGKELDFWNWQVGVSFYAGQ